MKISKYGFLISLGLLIAGLGCSRNAKTPQDTKVQEKPLEVKVGDSLFEPMSEEFMEKYQPDIQMAARWEGNHVWIAVLNRTNQPLQISAANFGVIIDGQLHRVTRENTLAQFPETNLLPGAAATGTIQFRKQSNLTGQRLVFYHEPETQPSMCIIKGTDSAAPKVPQQNAN